jgi:hypothetical protein
MSPANAAYFSTAATFSGLSSIFIVSRGSYTNCKCKHLDSGKSRRNRAAKVGVDLPGFGNVESPSGIANDSTLMMYPQAIKACHAGRTGPGPEGSLCPGHQG